MSLRQDRELGYLGVTRHNLLWILQEEQQTPKFLWEEWVLKWLSGTQNTPAAVSGKVGVVLPIKKISHRSCSHELTLVQLFTSGKTAPQTLDFYITSTFPVAFLTYPHARVSNNCHAQNT